MKYICGVLSSTATPGSQPSLALAHGAMFSVAVFYALNYYIIKGVLEVISPFALLGVRISSGLIFFGLVAWGKWRFERRDWLRLAACGLFGVALNQLFFVWGMSKTSPVNGGVIMTLTPVLVLVIARIMGEERLRSFRILGILIAFGGAAMLSLKGGSIDLGSDTVVGDLMILTNASSYALYLVLVKPLASKYPTLPLTAGLFAVGSLLAIPLTLPTLVHTPWTSLGLETFLGIGYVVLFVTLLAYSFNAWALRHVPSSQVGVYIYLQPMLVALLSPWLLSTPLEPLQWLYVGMVLAGVMLVNWSR